MASCHFLSASFPILFLEQSTESQNLSGLKNQAEALLVTLRKVLSRPDAVFQHWRGVMLNGGVPISNMRFSANAAVSWAGAWEHFDDFIRFPPDLVSEVN